MIEHYEFGKFTIDNKTYERNVKLIGTKILDCRHFDNHEIKLEDFIDLLAYQPNTLIIGTGFSGVIKVPTEIIKAIQSRGIKLIIQNTKEAVLKYNESIKNNQKVAAILHNTC